MSTLLEQNLYSPSITSIDANNDVANSQLANRTLFLKKSLEALKNYVATFKSDNKTDLDKITLRLDNLTNDLNNLSSASATLDVTTVAAKLTKMTSDLSKLETDFKNHKHNYAGSASPSGDANSVDVLDDNVSELNLVGVTETMPNKIRRNSDITIEGDKITATTFIGGLQGVADKAKKLHKPATITLSGDVQGAVKFDGSTDVVINTNIRDQNVTAGEYGTVGNFTLGMAGSFTVPDIIVNSLGLITSIRNRTITMPTNLATNGVTSSLNSEKKLFILGASEQDERAATYSQNGCFMKEKHLYSNSKEVVNLDDFQALKNKTYEGYTLGDACAHGVDTTIGGSADDDRLVTSNALYRHKHKYALSDTIDGKALYVHVYDDNINKTYIVNNNDKKVRLTRNTTMYIQGNGLFSHDLTATDNMFIPGGRIWIDSEKVPIDSEAWSGKADIIKDVSDAIDRSVEVTLAPSVAGTGLGVSVKVYAGSLLCYSPAGYVFADCKSDATCDNVVLAVTDGITNKVRVLYSGRYDLGSNTNNGKNCYVGINGLISYNPILTKGRYNKKIGYVENNFLVFEPTHYALYNRP